ncbi:MAG: sugar transferase [Clostridia bacterium]|nr:sugar transferase [Clostridia bacterium]
MFFKRWDALPAFMQTTEVRPYYDILKKKKLQMVCKSLFDFITALLLLLVLSVPMLFIGVWIKLDSKGPVFYRQERVTAYGKHFRIHKFRTMVNGADRLGSAVTTSNDARITKAGGKLRKLRLDELPQLLDVLQGTMSFVGTRPEAVKYVQEYIPEYNATLLMKAGITSEASIRFRDEDALLSGADDTDRVYVEKVLPQKMKWNLQSIRQFSIGNDIRTMFRTVVAVFGKDGKREKK